MAKYFFPSSPANADLIFAKFPITMAYLAGTYHNVFAEVFNLKKVTRKETFRLFPAMWLYRHAVELLLKAIIRDICGEQFSHIHDLTGLLEQAKSSPLVMQRLGKDEQFVTQAIAELEALGSGDGFRYGENKKGELHFRGLPPEVSSKAVHDNCEQLWNAIWRVHGPV